MGDPIATIADGASEPAPDLTDVNRIVVGFDERPASRDALALARELSDSTGAELIVSSVRSYWPNLLGPAGYAKAVAEDEAWLRREATKALEERRFSIRVVGGGFESGGLKEIAAAEDADLIVVGSTHRGLLGRVLPGSFGGKVLNNAPCAVAIAPLGLADSEFEVRRVAVGYDGSKEAVAALDLAIALAKKGSASLLIMAAVKLDMDVTGLEPVTAEAREEARLQSHLDRAAERAAEAGVKAEIKLLHGDPSHVLVDAAQSVDLLVLGSRGHYGPTRRLFLGSVATQVTRRAPCATLITPAA